jgi:hypothetical protein
MGGIDMEIKAEKGKNGKSAGQILAEMAEKEIEKRKAEVYKKLPFAADGFKSEKTPKGIVVKPTGFAIKVEEEAVKAPPKKAKKGSK